MSDDLESPARLAALEWEARQERARGIGEVLKALRERTRRER